ncbi:YibE/F family protein [Bacillaceae bacterium IKA-2]|nr:YibE/F family protein [Bacillaceae bacterium IKA-2]
MKNKFSFGLLTLLVFLAFYQVTEVNANLNQEIPAVDEFEESESADWFTEENNYYDDEFDESNYVTETTKGRIVEIIERSLDIDPFSGVEMEHHIVKVEITEGDYKGNVIRAESYKYPGDGSGYGKFQLKENDEVFVQIQFVSGTMSSAEIMDYTRDFPTIILIVIFIALLILVGQKQGLKAVVTLGITLLVIFKFMIPALFAGYNPVYLAILTGAIVTASTFILISGFTIKTLAAVSGTIGGLASAAFISIIFSNAMKLSGLHGEEERMLQLFHGEISIDFQGLLLAGIIIGALGAVMDVAISIASSMDEVQKADPTIKRKQLFKSGMNVGKDIMGTMANTLILAYVGAALPLLLLLYAYENKVSELIQMEFLVVEILRTAAGSIGLILAIPITALVGSLLIKNLKKKRI